MLQQLRKASKSPVATVVIGVLVLAFALWGVADIFRGGADTVVADVGGTQISDIEYDLQLKNQIRGYSQQMKTELTLEQARAMGLDRTVLENSINRAALDERSRGLGLVASRATVEAQFTSDPAFRGASGAFDPFLFQQALHADQLSGIGRHGYSSGLDKNGDADIIILILPFTALRGKEGWGTFLRLFLKNPYLNLNDFLTPSSL